MELLEPLGASWGSEIRWTDWPGLTRPRKIRCFSLFQAGPAGPRPAPGPRQAAKPAPGPSAARDRPGPLRASRGRPAPPGAARLLPGPPGASPGQPGAAQGRPGPPWPGPARHRKIRRVAPFQASQASPRQAAKCACLGAQTAKHDVCETASCGRQNASCGHQNASCGRQNSSCGRQTASCGRQNVSCGGQNASCGHQNASCRRQDAASKTSLLPMCSTCQDSEFIMGTSSSSGRATLLQSCSLHIGSCSQFRARCDCRVRIGVRMLGSVVWKPK